MRGFTVSVQKNAGVRKKKIVHPCSLKCTIWQPICKRLYLISRFFNVRTLLLIGIHV